VLKTKDEATGSLDRQQGRRLKMPGVGVDRIGYWFGIASTAPCGSADGMAVGIAQEAYLGIAWGTPKGAGMRAHRPAGWTAPRTVVTGIVNPALLGAAKVVHHGIAIGAHCGMPVRMACRTVRRMVLWVAGTVADGVAGGAQEGEMSPVGQAALLTAVRSWPRLAIFFTER